MPRIQGGRTKVYKSDLNLVLQNRASLETFFLNKNVRGMASGPLQVVWAREGDQAKCNSSTPLEDGVKFL